MTNQYSDLLSTTKELLVDELGIGGDVYDWALCCGFIATNEKFEPIDIEAENRLLEYTNIEDIGSDQIKFSNVFGDALLVPSWFLSDPELRDAHILKSATKVLNDYLSNQEDEEREKSVSDLQDYINEFNSKYGENFKLV